MNYYIFVPIALGIIGAIMAVQRMKYHQNFFSDYQKEIIDTVSKSDNIGFDLIRGLYLKNPKKKKK